MWHGIPWAIILARSFLRAFPFDWRGFFIPSPRSVSEAPLFSVAVPIHRALPAPEQVTLDYIPFALAGMVATSEADADGSSVDDLHIDGDGFGFLHWGFPLHGARGGNRTRVILLMRQDGMPTTSLVYIRPTGIAPSYTPPSGASPIFRATGLPQKEAQAGKKS